MCINSILTSDVNRGKFVKVIWALFVLSAQFFCKSKTVFKIKAIKKQSKTNKQTKVWRCERAQLTKNRKKHVVRAQGRRKAESKAAEGGRKKGLSSQVQNQSHRGGGRGDVWTDWLCGQMWRRERLGAQRR